MHVVDGFTCILVSIDSLKIALYAIFVKAAKNKKTRKVNMLALSCLL